MKAITLRNLPEAVARLVRHKAATEGISLNRAVIKVLEEHFATGRTYHDLDDFAGSWTDAEAQAFDRVLADQRALDVDLWK